MAIFKCKMCGGDLNVVEGVTVSECEYCGTKQTLPRVGEESIANLFNRANRLRMHCEFDKAEEVYEKIINLDDAEAEAHWGLVLCKYGIEYVEDPNTYERIPTCHRASFEAITEDNDYIAAIQNADSIRKELYEKEAKQIEELQKNVLQIVNQEKPFNVFICYKETDETGERTPDSVLAQDIYDELTEKGYRVFFSRITLEDKLGSAYEPYIFAALNSAKVMLVVGTKAAYMEAVWVRNEWSRYLKLMKKDHSKLLIPCYKDMDPYDMPESFAHLQAQNMGKIGAIQDLVRGVGKIVKADSNANANDAYAKSANSSVQIERAMSYLKDGNFATAATTCNEVLKSDPQNGMAYVGLLMSELKITEFSYNEFQKKKYKENENYQKAVENADDYIKEKFDSFEKLEILKKQKSKKNIFALVMSFFAMIVVAFLALEVVYAVSVKAFCTSDYNSDTLIKTFDALSFYKQSSAYSTMIKYEIGIKAFEKDETIKSIKTSGRKIPYNSLFPSIEKIIIANGVKQIDEKAFTNCDAKEIIIPNSVTSIGVQAFSYCDGITEIHIPKNVSSIDSTSFLNCIELEKITVSEKNTTYHSKNNCIIETTTNNLLLGCVYSVIPDYVTSIGERAFSASPYITNVVIPNNVTSIGNYAFADCENLTSVTISNSVTSIGDYAFSNCENLTSITIPDSVTSIGDLAFSGCKNLTSITIPDSVTSIGVSAFYGCENLTSVTISNSVTSIGVSAFFNCSSLKTAYFKSEAQKNEFTHCFPSKTKLIVQ